MVVWILPDPQPLIHNLKCQPSAHINKCAVTYKLREPWEIAKLMEPTINVIIYLIKKHTALHTWLRFSWCPILKIINVSWQLLPPPPPPQKKKQNKTPHL